MQDEASVSRDALYSIIKPIQYNGRIDKYGVKSMEHIADLCTYS